MIFSIISSSMTGYSQGSLGSITGDESELYAETKQVNQFFRRFNNEEDRLGERYYPGDSKYRDSEFRNVYLNMLFDLQNSKPIMILEWGGYPMNLLKKLFPY